MSAASPATSELNAFGSEDGAAAGARSVLTALRARPVRQVLGSARRVRAGHQRRRERLPLRPAVPGVAARRLPLRDSHVITPLSCRAGGRFVRLVLLRAAG